MLAMRQQPVPAPLEPGLRRPKKGDGKDKLKHRVRDALSSTETSAQKN